MNHRERKITSQLGERGEATSVKPSSYTQRYGLFKNGNTPLTCIPVITDSRAQHEGATVTRSETRHKQPHYQDSENINIMQESQRTAKRRKIEHMKSYELLRGETTSGSSCPSAHAILVSEVEKDEQLSRLANDESARSQVRDHALLGYFARLAKSSNENDTLDLNFIESLLQQGASVNTSDVYGQTIFHEVARAWSVEAAYFLFQQGADLDRSDIYGRSPLHVTAAANYPEMIKFLIDNGANPFAETKNERQTALHFAAKNDAVQCVKLLLANGAKINARDYKNRTPLQVAAEYNRANAARVLIEEGAPAGVMDDSGMSALVLLIKKMPSVAEKALDQFHAVDRPHRKEYFYLNYLENLHSVELEPKSDSSTQFPTSVTWAQSPTTVSCAQSPLTVVVEQQQFELLMHPTFQRLIHVKWNYMAKFKIWVEILLNFLLTLTYTGLGVTQPASPKSYYTPVTQHWWRILLEVVVGCLTLHEIFRELVDYRQSHRGYKKLKMARTAQIQRDMQFCHPRWPQEKEFLVQELSYVRGGKESSYVQDKWNYFDWITYIMLLSGFVLRFSNYKLKNEYYHDVYIKVMASTMIVVWVRLLKYARPFRTPGPFVVILGHVLTDTLKWLFVFSAFYIPYTASFWMIFGGRTSNPVSGYETVPRLLYQILRLTLVDNYNYSGLYSVAPEMAPFLCSTYLTLVTIVLLNLFIALMSDTFQRVYENAYANAAMQRARMIQNIEGDASKKKVAKYQQFIRDCCSPEALNYNETVSDAKESETLRKISDLENRVEEMRSLLKDCHYGQTVSKREMPERGAVSDDTACLGNSKNTPEDLLEQINERLKNIELTATCFGSSQHFYPPHFSWKQNMASASGLVNVDEVCDGPIENTCANGRENLSHDSGTLRESRRLRQLKLKKEIDKIKKIGEKNKTGGLHDNEVEGETSKA